MKKVIIIAVRLLGKPTMVLVRVVKVPTTRLALHLFGEENSIYHRAASGLIVGAIGIALPIPFHEGTAVYRIIEGVGTSIHAIGIVPFIDLIIFRVKLLEVKAKAQIDSLKEDLKEEEHVS